MVRHQPTIGSASPRLEGCGGEILRARKSRLRRPPRRYRSANLKAGTLPHRAFHDGSEEAASMCVQTSSDDPSSRSARRGSRPTSARALVPLAAVAALALSACGSTSNGSGSGTSASTADATRWITTTPAPTGDLGTVGWNLLLEPAKLDPAESNNYGESVVLANLCESLQRLNPDFTISDGLATVRANADRTSLVYSIDPRARFWDGKPVTGEDASYSLQKAWRPFGMPTWNNYFDSVERIAATGERELTVTLRHPDLMFEQIMATSAGAVVEKAYAEPLGDRFGTPSTGTMCSGPFRFDSWKSGANLKISRNDDYWRGTTAKTREIDFSFLAGDATQTTALLSDSIKGMYNPPFTALRQLGDHGQVFYGESLLGFYLIPSRKPGPLQDPRIREALYLALDRKAVADTAFSGAARPAHSLLPPAVYQGIDPARDESNGGSEADIERARRLVEEAGSPREPIILAANTSITESMNQTLQALAEAGRAIGLNTQFKSITLGQYYSLFNEPDGWKAVDADAFGSQYNVPVADPLTLYRAWSRPDNYENYGGFRDPATSRLIDQAAREPDLERRNALLGEIDRSLFAQKPWIPIVDVANTLYLGPGVTGPPASFVDFFSPWAMELGSTR